MKQSSIPKEMWVRNTDRHFQRDWKWVGMKGFWLITLISLLVLQLQADSKKMFKGQKALRYEGKNRPECVLGQKFTEVSEQISIHFAFIHSLVLRYKLSSLVMQSSCGNICSRLGHAPMVSSMAGQDTQEILTKKKYNFCPSMVA